jgi:uncharacterized repeat protein (TIGR02543 family)
MKLLGSGLASAFGLLLLLAACENPASPGPGPSVPTTYTVSFDSDGGSEIADIKKVPKGTVLSLREEEYVPKQTGYFFDGWYLQDDPKQTPYYSITVNGNITLVAKWIKLFSVALEMGEGGTLGLYPNLSVLPGSLFEAGAYRPFRKGFIFLHWYLKDDPSKAKVEGIRVDRDITLVAVWEEGWAVTLELNGGVYPRNYITVAQGDNVTVSLAEINPVREDYVFDGWYYDEGFTKPVPDTITVTGDITLYVKWVSLGDFEPLLGVWTGDAGTYLLYFDEQNRLSGFYLFVDEIRSFVWTDSVLDGKM